MELFYVKNSDGISPCMTSNTGYIAEEYGSIFLQMSSHNDSHYAYAKDIQFDQKDFIFIRAKKAAVYSQIDYLRGPI